MTIPDSLLEILCCPQSKTPLLMLDRQRLTTLNRHIAAGEVQYIDGSGVDTPLSAALVTRDHKVVYAIVEDIPVLLPERGIGTAQFKDF